MSVVTELQVNLSGAGTTEERVQLLIRIVDNGIGVAEEYLPLVFDPFYTTKPVGKGTGLGLFICYGIIKTMDGTIDVRSQIGNGTTIGVGATIGDSTSIGDSVKIWKKSILMGTR